MSEAFAIKAAVQASYFMDPIYTRIAGRLWERHQIKLADHIDTIKKVGRNLGEGLDFIPRDHKALKALLKMPGFALDDRRHLCEAVAAAATNGEGFREVGTPAIHWQVASGYVNVHLDGFGFVAIGPDGKKYYNPDLIQHIVDELGWEWVVGKVHKKYAGAGKLLGNIRPILPNSRNRYDLSIGGKYNLAKGKGWSLALEYTKALSGEEKKMVKLEILEW